MKNIIYTIGYAPHTLDSFINALKKHSITILVDVRSSPYSQFKSEFNREFLQAQLNKVKILYVFLGDKCGARALNRDCYVDGKVEYDILSKQPEFLEGIHLLKRNIFKHKIALMCAEKDPITCHRTILICRNLKNSNLKIKHILEDGSLEDNVVSEKRLLALFRVTGMDLFRSEQELLEEVYSRQGSKIAYVEKQEVMSG